MRIRPIIFLLLIIILLLSGCINNKPGNESDYSEYYYSVEIIPNGSGNFEIIVPIASNFRLNNDVITEIILENMIITEGDCSYSLMESINGIGLKIIGSSKIKIKSESDKMNEYYGLELSLYDNISNYYDETNEHWIFFNSTTIVNASVSIIVEDSDEFGAGGKEYTSPEYQTINTGWQKIIMKYEGWDV